MAQVGSGVAGSTRVISDPPAYVEWGAIIAGAITAAAISFVLLTFGTATGLSATSPWPNSGLSPKMLASIAVFWILAQQIGAFMIGGYIAGRLRSRWSEGDVEEAELRDGLHGALVWAVGIALGAVLFAFATTSAAKTAADVTSRTVTAATTSNLDLVSYYADVLLRTTGRQATPGTQAAPRGEPVSPELRAELVRLLGRALTNGSLAEADKSYLASLVAQRTGLNQQEAEKRVNDTFAEANRAVREAADKARRAAVLTGFVTAASLLISLAAACWAAQRGGHHRDTNVPARFTWGSAARRTPMS